MPRERLLFQYLLDKHGQPSKCARQNDSSSERFPAVILGTITRLLHRIYRGEKIAPGEPETSVQRPDAYVNSLFRAENSLFGSKNSLLYRLGNSAKKLEIPVA